MKPETNLTTNPPNKSTEQLRCVLHPDVTPPSWHAEPQQAVSVPLLPITPPTAKPLVDCAISGRTAQVAEKPAETEPEKRRERAYGTINVYENELEVKRSFTPLKSRTSTPRGTIKEFSDRSQFRLRQKLNRLRWPDGACYFLTLTVPDEWEFDPHALKLALRALYKRLGRIYPQIAWLWRQEWKFRKSGEYKGELRAHFHLFVFNIPVDELEFWNAARWAWWELVGSGNPDALNVGTDVKTVFNRQQATAYISKYMSKSESDAVIDDEGPGRAWGIAGELDFSPLVTLRATWATLVVLKACCLGWLAERNSSFWKRLSEYPGHVGFHVWGMGQEAVKIVLGLPWGERGERYHQLFVASLIL